MNFTKVNNMVEGDRCMFYDSLMALYLSLSLLYTVRIFIMQNDNIPYHSLVSQLGAFCRFLFKLPDLLSVGILLALQGHC